MYEFFRKIYHILKYIFFKIYNIKCNIELKKINILDNNKTVDKIVNEKVSISRFGDGEFKWILNSNDIPKFQEYSEKMSTRLREVLESNDSRVLICLPGILKKDDGFKFETKLFWEKIKHDYFSDIISLLKNNYYGNASVSRFYIDYKNYEGSTQRINNIKRVWDGKKILLVEGENTKFGVNNDLLENSLSIRRIICPGKNAFSKYDEILKIIKEEHKADELILLSLGPTASILAYDLGICNKQTIDIGHLDSEYEWYKKKAKERTSIDGKFNYELEENNEEATIDLKKYKEEIIRKVEIL